MWLDRHGVIHTESIADPYSIFSPSLIEEAAALGRLRRWRLSRWIERRLDAMHEEISQLPSEEKSRLSRRPAGRPPALPAGARLTPRSLSRGLSGIPLQWRPDILMALDELIV